MPVTFRFPRTGALAQEIARVQFLKKLQVRLREPYAVGSGGHLGDLVHRREAYQNHPDARIAQRETDRGLGQRLTFADQKVQGSRAFDIVGELSDLANVPAQKWGAAGRRIQQAVADQHRVERATVQNLADRVVLTTPGAAAPTGLPWGA